MKADSCCFTSPDLFIQTTHRKLLLMTTASDPGNMNSAPSMSEIILANGAQKP